MTTRFVRASLLVVLLTSAGSLAGFLFQYALAVALTPHEYGAINALLGVVTWLAMPAFAIQLVFARRAVTLLADGAPRPARALFRRVLVFVAILAAAEIAVFAIAGESVAARLALDPRALLVAAVVAATLLAYHLGLGAMQALGRPALFGGAQVTASGARLVLGATAAFAGLGAPGVLGATAIALAGTAVFLWARWGRSIASLEQKGGATTTTPPSDPPAFRALAAEALPLVAAFGGFQALLQLDLLCLQSYFGTSGAELPGLYGAAAVLARSVFHFPFAIVAVTFPLVARAHAIGAPHVGLLAKNLALTFSLATVAAAILGFFPEEVLRIYGRGEKLVAAAPFLRAYLVPMALAGIVQVFLHYFFALGHRSYALVILAGAAGAIPLFAIFRADPVALIRALSSTLAVMVVVSVLLVPIYARLRRAT